MTDSITERLERLLVICEEDGIYDARLLLPKLVTELEELTVRRFMEYLAKQNVDFIAPDAKTGKKVVLLFSYREDLVLGFLGKPLLH